MPDLAPITSWKIDTLRMTVFPPALVSIEGQNWWSDVTGDTPEISSLEQKKSIQKVVGPYDEGSLTFQLAPFRLDWVWGPAIDPDRIGEFQNIGSFPEACAKFKRLMLKWFELQNVPKIKRLALGVVAILPAGDRKSSYMQLAAYLPRVQIDIENSSDFLYQVNRARDSKSGVSELKLNRLSKWGAVKTTLLANIGPTAITGAVKHACRLELDINTAGEFPREIEKREAPKVLEELFALAEEIATKGDVP